MVILHTTLNVQELLNISITWNGTHPRATWSWSGLPAGCKSGVNGPYVQCHPTGACSVNPKNRTCPIRVNATDAAHGQIGLASGVVTINPPLAAQLEVNVTRGQVPFQAALYVNISGGSYLLAPNTQSPVYSVNWLTGDGNIGAFRGWNYTYVASGNFTVQVWVNDTTAPFDPLGIFYANVTIAVTPAPGKPGPFGLKGNQGWIIIGVLTFALVAAAAYGVLTRNEPLRLPPPEAWMFPPDESIRSRPNRPPPADGAGPPDKVSR
jgi:hypothetical protein